MLRTVGKELAKAPFTAWFGIIVIITYIVVAVFADSIAPFPEKEVVASEFEEWGETYLLGTDQLGRDIFSRLIYGARNTVGIALATTILAFVLGGLLGLIAATIGGWVDQLLSRFVDVIMAIPQLIFALLLLTVMKGRIPTVELGDFLTIRGDIITMILVIGCLDATRVFRLARAVAMNIVVMDFVEAAKLRGEGLWWIIRHELLPNSMAPLIAEFGLRFCFVFLLIASLSFLGLGIQPPTADWGSMVQENATLISFGDITPLIPAAAIALLTVAVNFVVDWMLHRSSGLKD
ncbi:MAG: ABC transporter permease [Pseudomonadota bacterium]